MFKSDENAASGIAKDLKALKRGKFLISVVFIALGVTMLIWPEDVMDIVSRACGALMAMGAAAMIVTYFIKKDRGLIDVGLLISAVVIGALGCQLVVSPEFLIALLPTIIGVLIVASGISDIGKSFIIRRENGEGFLIALILSIVTVILGVLIVLKPSILSNFIVRLIGISAIYDGVSDIWIMSQITGVVREVQKAVAAVEGEIAGGAPAAQGKKDPLGFLKNIGKKKEQKEDGAAPAAYDVPVETAAGQPEAAPVQEQAQAPAGAEDDILDGTYTAAKADDVEDAIEVPVKEAEPAEAPSEDPIPDVFEEAPEPEDNAFSFVSSVEETAGAVEEAAEEAAAEEISEAASAAEEVIEDAPEAVETAFSFAEEPVDVAEEPEETGFTFADEIKAAEDEATEEFHFTEE